MSAVNWHHKTALITGASSGIGAATALRLARAGLRVVLVARRAERLELLARQIQAQGGLAEWMAADLTQADHCRRIFERFPMADVLVNNAGQCWYGFLADMPEEEAVQLLRLNVEAAARLTRLYLPGMSARGFGRVINMGSIVGGFPMQGTALYAGSKAFMDAFTSALHRELRGTGVHAGVVRAGPVETDLFPLASARPGGQPLPGKAFAVSADRVARAVWRLLRWPRRFIYVPGYLRFMPWVEHAGGWLFDLIGPVLLKGSAGVRNPPSAPG